MTVIGHIIIPSDSVEMDNGENLRDLRVGDSIELRPDTGHGGLWITDSFHGQHREYVKLLYAELVTDCCSIQGVACKFTGTPHAHPFDLDGNIRRRPSA